MEQYAVELNDVWFSYDGIHALKEVNLKIRTGEFLALLGPNGGGKTTLIKIMLGMLKPTRGSVKLLGGDPSVVVDRVGYVPQETTINRGFPIRVLDVTLMGRLGRVGRRWRYTRSDVERAEQALDRMGMLKFKRRHMDRLSGGQRQRVIIARALVADPDILFMDEPTSSVDPQLHAELYELLKELNKSMTIVVVSHDISILSSYVKSVACVNQTVHFHDSGELTTEMLDKAYHCPVEVVAHGVPHRVLRSHKEHHDD